MDESAVARRVRRAYASQRFEKSLVELQSGVERHRLRPVWLIGLAAVAAGVGLWAVMATPLPTHQTAMVLAGWEPIPTVHDPALASGAAAACDPVDASGVSAMALLAQDQRGNAAAFLFAGSGNLLTCVAARDAGGEIVAATSGTTQLEATTSALTVENTITQPRTANFGGLVAVGGRVSQDVSSVTISRADGVSIVATVTDGYFIAWWPTDDRASRIVAIDGSGATVALLDRPF